MGTLELNGLRWHYGPVSLTFVVKCFIDISNVLRALPVLSECLLLFMLCGFLECSPRLADISQVIPATTIF